jgi:glycosyltransferase involved in cell wall biosynthesis
MGEGFGIPVLEAQACGVPAIVTDFSAMPEVCGAGWHVSYDRTWTGQSSWQAVPSVPDILEALEACYAQPDGAKQKMKDGATRHAAEYDVRKVMQQYWIPALRRIEHQFQDREPVRIESRLVTA